MEFSAYSEYKHSGVEWLGEVPSHWPNTRFKHVFFEKKHTQNMDLPFGAISFGKVVFKEDRANLTEELKANYQEVRQGEFLINPLNLNYDLKSLRTALSKIDVVVSSGYIVLDAKDDKNSKAYLEYLLYIFDIFHMKSMGAGIRQTINFNDIGKSEVSLPPINEQNQIAQFLDKETAKIDELIAKQEQLIVLLEEQRKSVISHAVTKGLNPNAPMKDSGVEWLGEVPEHWDVVRFGKIFDENKRKNLGMKETNVLSLSYGNIKEKNIDDNKGLLPESFETYQIIEPNDIIFRFTDLQNDKRSLRNAISKFHGIITSAYISVKTQQNSDFYNYLFRAYDLKKVFYSMGDGMRQSLKMDELNKMPVILPKIEEQNQIANFIQKENSKIDNLIQKQQELITQLKEYRTSVISYAVTGKIDVRELV